MSVLGDILKQFSSLLIAIIALLGIMFLPENTVQKIDSFFGFFSGARETSSALGNYIFQNSFSAVVIITIVYALTTQAKKWIEGKAEEKENINTES